MTNRLPWILIATASLFAGAGCGSTETVDPATVELCLERQLAGAEPDVEVRVRSEREDGEMGVRHVRYAVGAQGYDDLAGVALGLEPFEPSSTCVRVVTDAEVRYGDVTPLLDHLIELGFASIDVRAHEADPEGS